MAASRFRFGQLGLANLAFLGELDILLPSYPGIAVRTPQKSTTTVSTKGQIVLPRALRERRRWSAGTELVVEDTPDGVLLREKPAFAVTRPADVFGSLPWKGKAKSLADMKAGIEAEAKRRHARNRY